MKRSPLKLDFSVLDFMGSKSHWYVYMYPIHKKTSSVYIGYSVLLIQSISRNGREMKITRIVPNINILIYLIPPLNTSRYVCGTHYKPCWFKISNPFQGDLWINRNNKKEWRIPTDGWLIKVRTMNVNDIPHNPGNMQIRWINRTCVQMQQ